MSERKRVLLSTVATTSSWLFLLACSLYGMQATIAEAINAVSMCSPLFIISIDKDTTIFRYKRILIEDYCYAIGKKRRDPPTKSVGEPRMVAYAEVTLQIGCARRPRTQAEALECSRRSR